MLLFALDSLPLSGYNQGREYYKRKCIKMKAELEIISFVPNDFLTASEDDHNNGYTDVGDLLSNSDSIYKKVF